MMIDETISHYRIIEKLGEGGMGEVYLAEDLKLHRRVALKFLHPGIGSDRSLRARFLREAQAASALDHPNICTVHTVDETDDGSLFIVMARYEGETLRVRIARSALDTGETAQIASQIARGLSKAHAVGVIHRDIKPANIFLTDDGLVKILDFGVAKLADQTQITQQNTVVGTPLYMSPEQLRGETVDRRSDLWSLGVVLYEMLSGKHPFQRSADQVTPEAILHTEPVPLSRHIPAVDPRIESIVSGCLQRNTQDRPGSAEDLIVGLEPLATSPTPFTARDRIAGIRKRSEETERSPYPGLSSFGEDDAEFFHGRDAQIVSVWQKLSESYLISVIGPSGAGKTSFLRAGLTARCPSGWDVLRFTPAGSPGLSLRECLIPSLARDTAAMKDLLRQQNDDATVEAVRRWRRQHAEVLLVVDQFEELFTLSPSDEQARFADLLSRLTLEADVHVLISLRDDFFARCQEHPALAPVFESPTALAPLNDAALRRALGQPARDCGYDFEDDELVEDIIHEVEGERGTLPLLAFAMSKLWSMRDREKGILTRAAYESIGGVAGALARHAETVLEVAGAERTPLVREIFRNLVTPEGTRAARDRNDLLSVFGTREREGAEAILDQLVAARLLTTYETRDDEGLPHQRIEIVHESLLAAWPRLVRWQAQDADGALLRDQLRQAARMWGERRQSADLLWTGTAYREFTLWRERYPGGLSATEESYARAMARQDAKRRRRQRLLTTAVVTAALAIAALMSVFWKQAEHERGRAEAARLLALARLELDDYPTGALAYSIASLELADTEEARLFAVRALWMGPTESILDIGPTHTPRLHFQPHGELLAVANLIDSVYVITRDGDFLPTIDKHRMNTMNQSNLVNDGELLVVGASGGDRVELYSFPEGELQRTIRFADRGTFRVVGSELLTVARGADDGSGTVRRWPLVGEGGGELRGRFDANLDWDLHPSGEWFALAREGEIRKLTLQSDAPPREELLATLPSGGTGFRFTPEGERMLITQAEGFRVWSPDTGMGDLRTILGGDSDSGLDFLFLLRQEQRMVVGRSDRGRGIHIWDLELSPRERPRMLRTRPEGTWDGAFTPSGDWLATVGSRLSFWAVAQRKVRVIPGHGANLAFSSDSRWLGTAGIGGEGAWLVPLSIDSGVARRPLIEQGMGGYAQTVAALPVSGGFLFGRYNGGVWRVRMDTSEPQLIEFRPLTAPLTIAVDAEGKRVAIGYSNKGGVHVLDLETLEMLAEYPDLGEVWWKSLGFSESGDLYGVENGLIKRWDVEAETSEVLAGVEGGFATTKMNTSGRSMIGFVGELHSDFTVSGTATLFDLVTNTRREIELHVPSPRAMRFANDVLALGDADGTVWVGRFDGGEPHALIGHPGPVADIAISPDGKWIASTGGGELRIWPMPDLDEPPLHTLPHGELIAKLKSLTNVRVVRSDDSPGNYEFALEPFGGWATVPTW